MFRFVALLALVAAATAAPAGPPPAPYHAPAPYKEPVYEPRPYSYEYGVHDDYHGTNFNAQENSDGKAVQGSYQVHLPDGRVQTVKYTADHYTGYVADVSYEGVPTYPKYEPKPYAPAPHKPAPHPAPAPYHAPAPAPYHPPAPAYHGF